MWPFSVLRMRRQEGRRRAAKAVLVSAHAYEHLSLLHRQHVEDYLAEYFKSHSEIPYTVLRAKASFEYLAAYRAHAMSQLGYGTAVDGLEWEELLSRSWHILPAMLANEFQRFDPATDEVIAELAARGIRIVEASTMGRRWLNEMKSQHP